MGGLAIGAARPIQELECTSKKKGNANDCEDAQGNEGVDVVTQI